MSRKSKVRITHELRRLNFHNKTQQGILDLATLLNPKNPRLDKLLWEDQLQKFKASVLLSSSSINQMDIEQIQAQRKQGQSCQMAQANNNFVSKPVLSLGIGIHIGME